MMIGKLFGTARALKNQLEVYQPLKGNLALGYDGVFPASALITRQELMRVLGEGSIVRMYGDRTDWLKFYLDGKTLWVAVSPIGVTVNYRSLLTKGLLTGGKIVTIDGKRYKVRALTGTGGSASEWERLLYRVAASSVIQPADRWDTIPDASLTVSAYDNRTYIYSISPDLVGSNVLLRGKNLINVVFNIADNATYSDIGWRPVLELIP